MVKLYRRMLAAAATIAIVASCGDKTIIFPGGPGGAPVALSLTSSDFEVVVGKAITFAAVGRDEAGNPTTAAVTITSCNASVASVGSASSDDLWSTIVAVQGVSLGSTCLTVSVAGISETVTVTTGPAGVVISGPDTVGSGEEGQFTVSGVDAGGAVLSGTTAYVWSTSNGGRLVTDVADGLATGRSTGSVTMRIRAPGGASATKSVTVVPGTFAGTLSAASGLAGDVVSLTRAAGGSTWDADTEARFGGQYAWIESVSPDVLQMAMPSTGATGAQTLALSNIGPSQLEQEATFTANSAFGDAYTATNTSADGSIPAGAPEASAVMTANNNIYFSHGGFGLDELSRGWWNGPGADQIDHYFKVTTGGSAVTVTMTLEWDDGSDVDILVLTAGGGVLATGFSGSSSNEVVTWTFPANSVQYIVATMWTAGSNTTNFRFNLAGL